LVAICSRNVAMMDSNPRQAGRGEAGRGDLYL